MISEADVRSYRENGYLAVPEVFDEETLDTLRRVADSLSAAAKASGEMAEEPEAGTLVPRGRRLRWPRHKHKAFLALARDPRVLDIVEQLLGPDIRFSPPVDDLMVRPAERGSDTDWHQDWAFHPHTNDNMLSVEIALDDCYLANGPLQVIPGSHKGPIYNHHSGGVFCGRIDPTLTELHFDRAVPLTGKAGMVTLHHVRAVHGLAINRADSPRRIYVVRYAAADAWPLLGVDDLAAFDAQMVRGRATLEPRMTAVPVRMPLPA